MKKKLLVLSFILLLVGCSSDKKLKCTFQDENKNMKIGYTQEYVFNKSGKELKHYVITIEYDLFDNYIETLDRLGKGIKDVIDTDSICRSYKKNDNKCNVNVKKDKVIIKITGNNDDYLNTNYEALKKFYEGVNYECK